MIDIDNLNEEDSDFEDINAEDFSAKINNYTSQKLSDIIICNRYLGLFQDLSIIAMKELGIRRENGEVFNFEEYIEQELNKLPKINFSLPNVGSFFDMIKEKL